MSRYAYKRYRPVLTEDADGGGTVEALADFQYIWGDVLMGQAETVITTDINEPIEVGDILIIDGGQFRAISPVPRKLGTQEKAIGLERLNMPIEPIT